jgi:hypothetical protein
MNKTKEEARKVVEEFAKQPSEISDLMLHIFDEAYKTNPKLIVELGVGIPKMYHSGSSNCSLQQVKECTNARLVSFDIGDCKSVNNDPEWIFIIEDATYAGRNFKEVIDHYKLPEKVDVIFHDTSHFLIPTRREIAAWMPWLKSGGVFMFHDTNLRPTIEGTRRKDGTLIHRIDLGRSVIGPIEEYLGVKIDETREQITEIEGWTIIHYPYSCGLTILKKK